MYAARKGTNGELNNGTIRCSGKMKAKHAGWQLHDY